MDTVASTVMQLANITLERLTLALDFPSARAVVFGVQIGGHLFVEVLLLVVILFLLSQKSYKPPKRPLTKKEIDELCDEWVPESLIPPVTEEMRCTPPVLESAAGPHTVISGKDVVNFASANYLGLTGHERLLESCTSALEKYGVGSCGPRGFCGTIDVHLDCEVRIANFLGTPDSILYSYGLSTMFSAIPCFCKKGDIIVVDEGVHWGIQNGLYLSRSTVIYFKHNDMESLRNTLEKITAENKRAKKLRRYIVVEAVYQLLRNSLQCEDGRSGTFVIGNEHFPASLSDLPCVVESYKTYDDCALVKTADIGQIIMVREAGDTAPDMVEYRHGLTPPMRDARKRRFRREPDLNPELVQRAEKDLLNIMAGGTVENADAEANEQEEDGDHNARKANKKPEPAPEAKPDVPETTANAKEPERSDSDESDDSM